MASNGVCWASLMKRGSKWSNMSRFGTGFLSYKPIHQEHILQYLVRCVCPNDCVGLSSDAQYVTNQTLATLSRQLSPLGLLTSKGVVLYNNLQRTAGMGFKCKNLESDSWTHLLACVCAERILSGRQLQWISIDGHLSSGLLLLGGSPHKLNSPDQLTTRFLFRSDLCVTSSTLSSDLAYDNSGSFPLYSY